MASGKTKEIEEEAMFTSRFNFRGASNEGRDNRRSPSQPQRFSAPRSTESSGPGNVSTGKSVSRRSACNYCGKLNHWEADCDLKKLDDQIVQLQVRPANLHRPKTQAHVVEFEEETELTAV